MHALKTVPRRISHSKNAVGTICGSAPSRHSSWAASVLNGEDASSARSNNSLAEALRISNRKGKEREPSNSPIILPGNSSDTPSSRPKDHATKTCEKTQGSNTSKSEAPTMYQIFSKITEMSTSRPKNSKRINRKKGLKKTQPFPPAAPSHGELDEAQRRAKALAELLSKVDSLPEAKESSRFDMLKVKSDENALFKSLQHQLRKKAAVKGVEEAARQHQFPEVSELSLDNWIGESWSDSLIPGESSMDDRSSPPHILNQDILTSGELEPTPMTLTDVAPRSEFQPISTLAHGLDRVLFNPGVHWLRDPRSRVYNFSPWLEKIPRVNDFDFSRLTGFVKSSRDEDLRALAKQEKKKFAGSTSSLTGYLSQIYFLLSEFKELDYSTLSQHFKSAPTTFTSGQRMPVQGTLNYKDGVYAIDAHTAEYDDPDKNVLTWMGTLLENFLTSKPEEFKQLMRSAALPDATNEKPLKEAYRYAKSKNMVMRSQLDCQDSRLPGTGVFDLKTRACVTIRMDILNHEENSGYLIKSQHGEVESFEKEYYDLIRSGFLKYGFQARIGNMDGVMVTYHNSERIFGFQYIPLSEMDDRLFGNTPGIGEAVFDKAVGMLEAVLEQAAACFPKQSVLCSLETRMPGKVLEVYVQPENWKGDLDERPIQKLVVTCEHEVAGQPVKAYAAMRQPDQWKVKYTIGKPLISEEDIRRDLKYLEARKKRILTLPSYVSIDDAETYWRSLNYNPSVDRVVIPKVFSIDAFGTPNSSVESYRQMSREGRKLTEQLEAEEKGKPKLVVGEGVYVEDEEWNRTFEKKMVGWGESRVSGVDATIGGKSTVHSTQETAADGSKS